MFSPLIDGCNYHTTWQSNSRMRFVLVHHGEKFAGLKTRTTRKEFMTKIEDLIFIRTKYNIAKARRLIKEAK